MVLIFGRFGSRLFVFIVEFFLNLLILHLAIHVNGMNVEI